MYMRSHPTFDMFLHIAHVRHSRDNWFGVKLWADGDPLEDQADAALARTGMKAVRGGAFALCIVM